MPATMSAIWAMRHRGTYALALFLVFLAVVVAVGLGVRRLRRWFLVSGCLRVFVALTLMATSTRYAISPRILLVLWPPFVSFTGCALSLRSPVK
jgi:high-affinity Fe2+/Pb2+ permease